MVIIIAMNVTAAIISAWGAFKPTNILANAPGITPVSLVQHIKINSLSFQLAFLSGSAQSKTVIGLAINIKIKTTPKAGQKYLFKREKST